MMHVERLTIPTAPPVDAIAAILHLRVGGDSELENEAIDHALAAAQELEHYAQLALLTQTIRVTLPEWPCVDIFPLPIAPMLTGAAVTVTDDAGPFAGFTALSGLRPALRLAADRPIGKVIIDYEAGFGADHNAIPRDLHLAILDQATASFDCRGAFDGKNNGMSPHLARIAARYRRVTL